MSEKNELSIKHRKSANSENDVLSVIDLTKEREPERISVLPIRDRTKHWTNDPIGWAVSVGGIALMVLIALW